MDWLAKESWNFSRPDVVDVFTGPADNVQAVQLTTIYDKVDALQPRKVALVTQRLNETEGYEDNVRVVYRALRNRESAFVAQLTAEGVLHETFSARELSERIGEICAPEAFDMCVVAGEVCSQSISIATELRNAGFTRPIYLEITEEEANKDTSLDAAAANAERLRAVDLLSQFVYLTKSKRSPRTIEFKSIGTLSVGDVDPMSDEHYLRRVAVAVTQRLASSPASNGLNLRVLVQPVIRKSDTGGWWTQLGSLRESKIDVQLWYDRFIGHPRRKLWIGFHTSDASAIRRFVTHGSLDIGEDDSVQDRRSGGWIVRKSRRKIYFTRPVFEKYRNRHGASYFYGRYLVPRDGTIRKLGVNSATKQIVNFVQQIVSPVRRGTISAHQSARLEKVTRISFNSAGWQKPTGDARKYESASTYNYKYGFGHEDWLFRSEWLIDGWRYAFIQGVNKSHSKLVRRGQPIDLTLFTIDPAKRRRYVAIIRGVECLDNDQSKDALALFKKNGWYNTMCDEIKAVGGNASALGTARFAKHVLNVRFRQENVTRFPLDQFAKPGDPILKLTRYQLYDLDGESPSRTARRGDRTLPRVRGWVRRGYGPVQCDPEHARMQARLMKELEREYARRHILRENEFVDVSVRTRTELILFEIKSDLDPRSVIRHALGQILEYAYHPLRTHNLPIRMVIVGRRPLTDNDKEYLERLRNLFALPLVYRVVNSVQRD